MKQDRLRTPWGRRVIREGLSEEAVLEAVCEA